MPTAVMRMLVDPASGLTQDAVDRAYLAGYDQIPWACRTQLKNGELQIERLVAESGRLVFPMRVAERGELMISTGTLMQRDRPYHLEIELARGKLNVVRNQLAEWVSLGLIVPAPVDVALRQAQETFSRAVTVPDQPTVAAELARLALAEAVEAGELLMDCYVDQALSMRMRQMGRLPTLFGIKIGHRAVAPAALSQVTSVFNTLMISLLWREIEQSEGVFDWQIPDQQIQWCADHGVRCLGGPLLRLDSQSLPDWVALWEGDFDNFLTCVTDYMTQVVSRYRGRVALWQSAAKVNFAQVMSLQEDQMLQLAVRSIEVSRQIDPDTPVIIRLDQPWGEYLRKGEFDLSPLHFADALVRSGLPLGGIGLDINVGYVPTGSAARDRLDFSRLLDLWSCLGLPLHILLVHPSSSHPDPRARGSDAVVTADQTYTPESQAQWVRRYLPVLLSKSFVASVTYGQLSDAEWHEYPHGGLFDHGGAAKPAFLAMSQLRKKYLQ